MMFQEKCKKVQVCVAKTLNLLDSEGHEEEMSSYLNDAAQEGSGIAAYMLWSKMRSSLSVSLLTFCFKRLCLFYKCDMIYFDF